MECLKKKKVTLVEEYTILVLFLQILCKFEIFKFREKKNEK